MYPIVKVEDGEGKKGEERKREESRKNRRTKEGDEREKVKHLVLCLKLGSIFT